MDRLRSYKVTIDGEAVGSLRRGDDITYDVAPGRHTVQLRIDWARSQPLEVDLAAGEEAHLVCRARNPLAALYWITFGRKRYVRLERAA